MNSLQKLLNKLENKLYIIKKYSKKIILKLLINNNKNLFISFY